MSFFSKVDEKKGIILAISGVIGIGVIAWLYKNLKKNRGKGIEEDQQQFDIDRQIEKFRQSVNTINPNLEDLKKILTFATQVSKQTILIQSRQFKKKRRQFTRQSKKSRMNQYMTLVADGVIEIQNLGQTQRKLVLQKLGVSEEMLMKYQREIGIFMQELIGRFQQNLGSKSMTLQEVRDCIKLEINFLTKYGEQTADQIVYATKNWSQQNKQMIPYLVSIIMTDGAFENYPEIDEEYLQSEQAKYQQYLMAELQQLQQVMTPMMLKLNKIAGNSRGMDMGNMGGMLGMGNMGGLGDITSEQLQQFQMQDPAAFEKLMGMMYPGQG